MVTAMQSLSSEISMFWEKALAFHGHSCPGLALGCRVAAAALAHLDMREPSRDEEMVCVAETDSCAVDAIQAVTGCTLGKGNLLLRPRGKHVFSFYRRDGSDGIRITWKARAHDMERPERTLHFLSAPASDLYTLSETVRPLPQKALLSPSLACSLCGEATAEPYIRLRDGRPQCLDCYVSASRILP